MALTSTQAKSLNAKKQAMYDQKAATQGMRDARWAKLCNTVDPDHSLTEAERNRRATALMKSQMLACNVAKAKKRMQTLAQAADKARYQEARTTATHGCRLCGDDGAIDVMCPAHLAEQRKAFSH